MASYSLPRIIDQADLMIADLDTPHATGPGLSALPILVLVGLGPESSTIQALAAGSDEPANAPFGWDTLIARLRAAMSDHLQSDGASRAGRTRDRTTLGEVLGRPTGTGSQRSPGSEPEPGIHLTDREREVLSWAGRGKTSAEIASILSLTVRTVDFHCHNARKRLDVMNRTQAVAKAIAHGLISL